MIVKTDIYHKIQEIYPDIGRCGIDIEVKFDFEPFIRISS